MTRDQLELALAREGLTRPQADAVMAAAEAYATAQAGKALAALWPPPGPVHWQPPEPYPDGPACKAAGTAAFTVLRRDVTCGACRQTPAWKEAA